MIHLIGFWAWLMRGSGEGPGLRRFLTPWLLLHALIGIGLAIYVRCTLQDAGRSVLLPLAGVLVGLSFAWSGNAQALLQERTIEAMARVRKGGLYEYVYPYQAAILTILVALVLWGLAGLGVFDETWPTPRVVTSYRLVCITIYAWTSLTLQECWQVVLSSQMMTLARWELMKPPADDHKD